MYWRGDLLGSCLPLQPSCTYVVLNPPVLVSTLAQACNTRCLVATLSGLVAVDLSLCVLPFVIVILKPAKGPLLAWARIDLIKRQFELGLAAVGFSPCNGSWTERIHQLRRGNHHFYTSMFWQSQRGCAFSANDCRRWCYLTVARQNWWKPSYLRNRAFMDMGLPGTTDNGMAGNLVRTPFWLKPLRLKLYWLKSARANTYSRLVALAGQVTAIGRAVRREVGPFWYSALQNNEERSW